jgi:hypothetical protein
LGLRGPFGPFFREKLLRDACAGQIERCHNQAPIDQRCRVKTGPRGPSGEDNPCDGHAKVHVMPPRGAGGVDEFEVGEHGDGQENHHQQDDFLARLDSEQDKDDHVPAGGESGKGLVFGLHAGVGEIDDGAVDDDDNGEPSGPAGQQV